MAGKPTTLGDREQAKINELQQAGHQVRDCIVSHDDHSVIIWYLDKDERALKSARVK